MGVSQSQDDREREARRRALSAARSKKHRGVLRAERAEMRARVQALEADLVQQRAREKALVSELKRLRANSERLDNELVETEDTLSGLEAALSFEPHVLEDLSHTARLDAVEVRGRLRAIWLPAPEVPHLSIFRDAIIFAAMMRPIENARVQADLMRPLGPEVRTAAKTTTAEICAVKAYLERPLRQ